MVVTIKKKIISCIIYKFIADKNDSKVIALRPTGQLKIVNVQWADVLLRLRDTLEVDSGDLRGCSLFHLLTLLYILSFLYCAFEPLSLVNVCARGRSRNYRGHKTFQHKNNDTRHGREIPSFPLASSSVLNALFSLGIQHYSALAPNIVYSTSRASIFHFAQ